MTLMRPLLIVAAVAIATPAVAQDALRAQMQMNELQAQQQMLQQQSVAQHNEIVAMDARLRTEQAAARIASERQPASLPRLPYDGSGTTPGSLSLPGGIPDEALADSNRRVREITKNRR